MIFLNTLGRTALCLLTFAVAGLHAQEAPAAANTAAGASATPPASPVSTDPDYRLSFGDAITVTIHGEPDMSTAQRIDKRGLIRIPYTGDLYLANKSVREAESFLEQTFITKNILKKPLVNITVSEYAPREVTLIGAVGNPGIFNMRREAASMEIVELITSVGGFKPTAKSDQVRVIHINEAGRETTTEIDVEAMMYNRKNARKSFLIYPGDRLIIPERLF